MGKSTSTAPSKTEAKVSPYLISTHLMRDFAVIGQNAENGRHAAFPHTSRKPRASNMPRSQPGEIRNPRYKKMEWLDDKIQRKATRQHSKRDAGDHKKIKFTNPPLKQFVWPHVPDTQSSETKNTQR